MDRRLAQPREPREHAQRQAPALDRLQRQGNTEGGEDAGPGEVRKRQHGVEGAELGHPEVKALGLVAEDDGMAEGPDDQAEPEPKGQEEKGEATGGPVFDEVGDEEPPRRHEGEGAGDTGEVEDDDQRQPRQRRKVAEPDPEQEQVGGPARLGRVAVLPGPGALPALPHLGDVRGGVVPEVEEADEDVARGLGRVGVGVGDGGDDGEGEADEEWQAPVVHGGGRVTSSFAPLPFPLP